MKSNITNTTLEIIHPSLNWKAAYKENSICGPAAIRLDERQILSFCHCRYDDWEERDLTLDKKRFFRKGGARVHTATGHFPNGNSITQTAKFSGNCCRITTDLKWCSGNALKSHFEITSFVLPGTWKRVLAIPQFTWTELPKSGVLKFSHDTTALVFEDENGYCLEAGCGDDLWRWDNGLLNAKSVENSFIIDVQSAKIIVSHPIATANEQSPIMPVPRFYRFESYFAWWGPNCQTQSAINPGTIQKFEDECWEGRTIQQNFRKFIRQFANSDKIDCSMTIDSGMTPHFCNAGSHFNRKEQARHWDIIAILEAAVWMRQTLGNYCAIQVKQPDDWNQLPSMKGLGLINGFNAEPEE